jgi:DNA-binding MarR family transcriptional regulator
MATTRQKKSGAQGSAPRGARGTSATRPARRAAPGADQDLAANEPTTGRPQHPTLERRAAYRFSILANLYANALAEMYTRSFELTMADWKTLAIIGHYEPIHPGAIAQRTSMVPEGVSRALERLVAKGVASRAIDEADRRRIVVTLTSKGRKVFGEIEAVRARMEDDFLRVLTKAEREALFSILDRLDAHAHETMASPDAWERYVRAA